jgi:hypothetical protein
MIRFDFEYYVSYKLNKHALAVMSLHADKEGLQYSISNRRIIFNTLTQEQNITVNMLEFTINNHGLN